MTPREIDLIERSDEILRYSIRFPANKKDMADRVQVFVEETMDIPVSFLRKGGSLIRDEVGRVFAPSISELRTAAARAIRAERWRALGITTESSESGTAAPLIIAQEVAWAQKHAPNGTAGDISALPPEVGREKVGGHEAMRALEEIVETIENTPEPIIPLKRTQLRTELRLAIRARIDSHVDLDAVFGDRVKAAVAKAKARPAQETQAG